ncbi:MULTISPECIES: hypothetical protein [unclassified Nostoc]
MKCKRVRIDFLYAQTVTLSLVVCQGNTVWFEPLAIADRGIMYGCAKVL